MPLQLAWLECIGGLIFSMNSILQLVDSLRPDELIWLHAYLTGRVHALMPATHLQMSGRPMGAQSRGPDATEMMNPPLREHATGAPSEHSTLPGGLGAVYLTPTCGDTCRLCGRRACQVTNPHDDHVCFPCEQQLLRQRHRQAESESGSCS